MRFYRKSWIFRPCSWIFLFAAVVGGSLQLRAQAALDYTEKKQKAIDLYKQSRFVEAVPVLEELAAANDKDQTVFTMLGFCLYTSIGTTKDEGKRKDLAERARKALSRAKELGDKSVLTDQILTKLAAGTPGVHKFSDNAEADEAMQEAEKLFVSGRLEGAIDQYKKALGADPGLYDAALYIGDCYYKIPGKIDEAPEWYAKAIAIDPSRETAYRYWADVLTTQGKASEARDKYIDAFISDPYNRLARSALNVSVKGQHQSFVYPVVAIPTKVEVKPNRDTNITLDENMLKEKKDSASAAWLMYGLTRSLWATEKFAKEYPKEKTYRHSLKEEADAIRSAITVLDEKERKKKTLDQSLATLIRLNDDGVLEPYILLARPDDGIDKDYSWYLQQHRDLLHRYVVKWMIVDEEK